MRSTLFPLVVSLFVASVAMALDPPIVDANGSSLSTSATDFGRLGLHTSDLVTGLDTPWDLVWGPDGWIWFTERAGVISRVDPKTGEVARVASVASYERGESGLLGMAFDPDFAAHPYVYVVQSYATGSGIANRLLRFQYERSSLSDRRVLLDGILGNTYHDGSRLAFGPDGYLYLTTGDAGHPELAQDTSSLNGKVLRITRDGDPAPGNPFNNAVFSYGHRNPQGIAFEPATGTLYITEHGPSDNDEVSIVTAGGNYGWPNVHGFCDGDTPGETSFCAMNPVIEPIAAWTPTIAPAGAAFYGSNAIPGWRGSLLFTTLKGSALIRIALSADGRPVAQQVIAEGVYGRLRDVLVGPDGSLYIATSNRDGRGSVRRGDDRILRVAR